MKKLQALRDKLHLQREDIEYTNKLLDQERQELQATREQVSTVQSKVRTNLRGLAKHTEPTQDDGKAGDDSGHHEDEQLRHTFRTILDHAIRDLKTNLQQQTEERAMQRNVADEGVREVSVMFEDEEAVFRVNEAYNFESLLEDVCRYFEEDPLAYELCRADGAVWDNNAGVRQSLSEFENQYGQVFLREQEKAVEEEEEEVVDDLLGLLVGKKEEAAEEEEEAAAGAAEGGPPKKKLNRRQLIIESPIFALFLTLFIFGLNSRRSIPDSFNQVSAIRTALAEESFGDFNEKEMADIANFEELFDWMENVFAPGLFPDSKYNGAEVLPREVGVVMGYNKIVGGIRFRQVRTNASIGCPKVVLNERTMVSGKSGEHYTQFFVEDCYADPQANGWLNEGNEPFGPAVELLEQYGSCDNINVVDAPPGASQIAVTAADRKTRLCKMFMYTSAADNGEVAMESVSGAAYPGSGYVRDVDLPVVCRELEGVEPSGLCLRSPTLRDDIIAAVNQMKDNLWLDAGTRILMIKVTFYNGNVDNYLATTFMFEFTLGGVVVATTKYGTLNTATIDFEKKPLTAVAEMGTYVIIFYYLIDQILIFRRIVKSGRWFMEYFYDIWSVVECLVLIIFFIAVMTRLSLFGQLYPVPMIFEPDFSDWTAIAIQYFREASEPERCCRCCCCRCCCCCCCRRRCCCYRRCRCRRCRRRRRRCCCCCCCCCCWLAAAAAGCLHTSTFPIWQVLALVQLRLDLRARALLQDVQVHAAQCGHEHALVGAPDESRTRSLPPSRAGCLLNRRLRVRIPLQVLTRSGKDVSYFIFILGTLLISFALMANQMMGATIIGSACRHCREQWARTGQLLLREAPAGIGQSGQSAFVVCTGTRRSAAR